MADGKVDSRRLALLDDCPAGASRSESVAFSYHNYSKTEMLRKFFDVVVRMDEIVPESLADFAADQAQRIGVSPELARDIIDAAAIREPRKVKAILNALRVAHEAVKRSHEQSLLSPGVSQCWSLPDWFRGWLQVSRTARNLQPAPVFRKSRASY
jgi:hypothetical protein